MLVFGSVPLRCSPSVSVFWDNLDHGRSNEPMNPCPEWIHRFIWSTMIRVISDHWSWSGSSQRNAPFICMYVFSELFFWTYVSRAQTARYTVFIDTTAVVTLAVCALIGTSTLPPTVTASTGRQILPITNKS